jgi:electron transfer flavoprotein beta subunit
MKPFTQSSKVISFSLPDEKTGVKLIDPENMDELVKLLHEEAKVI